MLSKIYINPSELEDTNFTYALGSTTPNRNFTESYVNLNELVQMIQSLANEQAATLASMTVNNENNETIPLPVAAAKWEVYNALLNKFTNAEL